MDLKTLKLRVNNMNSIKTNTTSRQFAIANNVNPLRMKNLINADSSIKPKFYRNRMYYYEPEKIAAWFEKNLHKFSVEVKSVNVHGGDFFCGKGGHYALSSTRVKGKFHCSGCESRVIAANKGGLKGSTKKGKVAVSSVHCDLTRHGDIMLKRELAAIDGADNINNWSEL